MRLAVIPARGGSKRIPRKNIREFCGKPIIAWSIEAALQSKCFDRVIVSTDELEIADVARRFGAEVPFLRPAELADDYTGTIAVTKHAIDWYEDKSFSLDYVCCIYATAPFISSKDIQDGLKRILENNSDYVFTVTTFPSPIQRAFKINKNGGVEMFQPECFYKRSQDLEEAYHDAGQFYWGRKDAWKEEKIIFSKNSFPLTLPRYRVQDIDTMEDWKYAELMFSQLQLIQQ